MPRINASRIEQGKPVWVDPTRAGKVARWMDDPKAQLLCLEVGQTGVSTVGMPDGVAFRDGSTTFDIATAWLLPRRPRVLAEDVSDVR